MKNKEETGIITVEWFSELYSTVQMDVHYWLHQKGSENFFAELDFAKKYFQQLYDSFLEHLFKEYNNNINNDVWDEETGKSKRIIFSKKEELHPYLGMEPLIDIKRFHADFDVKWDFEIDYSTVMKPIIDTKCYNGKVLLGLSFYNHNRISIEHGLCAVFDKLDLILMDSYDFLGIIDNFKFGYY